MKRRLQRFLQIVLMLFVFAMMLPNLKAQTIGSQIRIGADSTISYWNGTTWIAVAPGLPGQSLQFTNGIPTWIGNPTPITDIDGNVYDIVKIGTQVWMKQNLNVTHYRNGEAIPNVTDDGAWVGLTTGAYCNYNNDANNATTYGRLYNWYTVADARNFCPTGWHVPSDVEWTTLTTYLGGEGIAGGKLKEIGTNHWNSPNTGATNESGFSALPGGSRISSNGTFGNVGFYVSWWASTEYTSAYSIYRYMGWSSNSIYNYYNLNNDGLSVRCLKD